MSAPVRPPIFFDLLSGTDRPPSEVSEEAGYLLDDLVWDVRRWPSWLIDDDGGRRVALSVIAHEARRRAVISFSAGAGRGRIVATPDATGYLRFEVAMEDAGAVVLVAYVERVWEEYDLWPPGAVAAFGEEPPGRMGKHRNWVSMAVDAWPVLAEVTGGIGRLNLLCLDEEAESRRGG